MKSRTLVFCIAAATFSIRHSAFSIAAEPPAAAAQEGVRLWEGGPFWADRNVGAERPSDFGWFFNWGGTLAAIFLTATGVGIEEKWWYKERTGYLWASEPYAEGPNADCSWRLHFGPRGIGTDFCWDRHFGVPVRPVKDE